MNSIELFLEIHKTTKRFQSCGIPVTVEQGPGSMQFFFSMYHNKASVVVLYPHQYEEMNRHVFSTVQELAVREFNTVMSRIDYRKDRQNEAAIIVRNAMYDERGCHFAPAAYAVGCYFAMWLEIYPRWCHEQY